MQHICCQILGGLKSFGEMLLSFLVLSMLSLLAGWSRPSSSSTMKRGGWAVLESWNEEIEDDRGGERKKC